MEAVLIVCWECVKYGQCEKHLNEDIFDEVRIANLRVDEP